MLINMIVPHCCVPQLVVPVFVLQWARVRYEIALQRGVIRAYSGQHKMHARRWDGTQEGFCVYHGHENNG